MQLNQGNNINRIYKSPVKNSRGELPNNESIGQKMKNMNENSSVRTKVNMQRNQTNMKKSPGTSMLSQVGKPQNVERSVGNGSVNGNLNLKELMLHKGSKCKCQPKNGNDDIFTKNEDSQYDEVSMGSSQDHSIDAQLKGHSKKQEKTK